MPPFRDDQILIIAPGSQTTLAQLGLPESFSPARFRFRSRMFPAQTPGEFEPIKIRRKEKALVKASDAGTNGDDNTAPPPTNPIPSTNSAPKSDEAEWEEDRVSEEGAIWPIREGRILDWPAFYALMGHVYNTVNPPFHTPIMLLTQPVWTAKDHERVTQFFFEKFKVPAFTLFDSAMATSYAYGVPTATVVDVGLTKSDITCITDFVLHDLGRGLAVPNCGGEALTQRLEELLRGRKGFSRDVCEQLKMSSICEILPPDVALPTSDISGPAAAAATVASSNPAAAASTGADGAPPGQRKASVVAELPRGPGPGTQVGEETKLEDEEGVLDIASIVTGGNMNDYLAQKEKQKAEKAAAKLSKKTADAQQNAHASTASGGSGATGNSAAAAAAAAASRAARLPNSKRVRNSFIYEDFALHDAMKKAGMTDQGMADMRSALSDGPNKRQKTPEPASATSDKPVDGLTAPESSSNDAQPTGGFRREVEVGTERFQAATGGVLERLASAIHQSVSSCPDIGRRGDLWDSLIVVGNGAKVRGFREALLAALQTKYLISPSSATMFTSELPSNTSTPLATGANTPQPPFAGQSSSLQSHGSGVNPLLIAATTAQHHQQQHSNPSTVPPHMQHPSTAASMTTTTTNTMPSLHVGHGQTPTSIKLAKIPEYFAEWKEVGYDEAHFLGAQVAAKVVFVADGGASKGYMTRTDYNDQGPTGIHEVGV